MIRLGRVVCKQETFCCNWSRVVRLVVVTEHWGKKSALTLILYRETLYRRVHRTKRTPRCRRCGPNGPILDKMHYLLFLFYKQ